MILKFFIILITIKELLAQNCQLNATHMDKKWIYATKPTPTTWDVLHTDYIKDQTSLYLICSNMKDGREIHCDRGTFKELNNPIPICAARIKAQVVLLPRDNSCSRLKGELYQVRYTLPSVNVIPLYTVCYSKVNEQALYSRHKAYGFNLPASAAYQRPTFTKNNVVSRERELSFQAANIYNAFVRLLGPKQRYVPDSRTLILERGHLTNSQDFPSYDQLDETFKYINVMPQFRGSNRSNWKRIENWIHSLPSSNTYVEVVTGSFDNLRLPHSENNTLLPMSLMSDGRNPIPLWSYKVIKYSNTCYVFITLNNDFNTNPNMNTPYCRSVACPNGLRFNTAENSGTSYCCNYNHFVRNIGNHAKLC